MLAIGDVTFGVFWITDPSEFIRTAIVSVFTCRFQYPAYIY